MNLQRAKEIADSPDMIEVSYLGVPVVIQSVEEGSATAEIYPLELPTDRQFVPVDALSEQFTEPDIPFI